MPSTWRIAATRSSPGCRFTIAVLAVLAAGVGSLETIETAETISTKTTAAIVQNQATDAWGFFSRAEPEKRRSTISAPTRPPRTKVEGYKAKSAQYEKQSRETQSRAEELEKQVKEQNESSEKHEHRHQILTISATLLHISIAIAHHRDHHARPALALQHGDRARPAGRARRRALAFI